MIIDLIGSKSLLLFVDHVTFLAGRFLSIKTIENEYDLLWQLNVCLRKVFALLGVKEKGVAHLPNLLHLLPPSLARFFDTCISFRLELAEEVSVLRD